MILTAGSHQIPLIRRAHDLGFAVVAADRSADAPALREADFVEQVDVTDCAAVLSVARRHGVCGVVAEQTDVAVRTGAFVAREMGLPGISVEAARRATDKFEMREACRNAGIPTPEYRLVETANEAASAARSIGFPVIVKPVDNQGSRGVAKVTGPADINDAFARARRASSTARVLIEEMMTGTEGSIESFIRDGEITVLGYCDKVKSAPPFAFDLRLIYPGDYPSSVIADVIELNARVIRALDIRLGFAHAEFIVTQAGVRLIEIAARGCGARVVTDLLPAMTGKDLVGLRIGQAVGEPVAWQPSAGHGFGILRFMELPPGRILHVGDKEAAARLEGVVALHFPKCPGDVISVPENTDGRPGFVIAVGESRAEVIALADTAIRTLNVQVSA